MLKALGFKALNLPLFSIKFYTNFNFLKSKQHEKFFIGGIIYCYAARLQCKKR